MHTLLCMQGINACMVFGYCAWGASVVRGDPLVLASVHATSMRRIARYNKIALADCAKCTQFAAGRMRGLDNEDWAGPGGSEHWKTRAPNFKKNRLVENSVESLQKAD